MFCKIYVLFFIYFIIQDSRRNRFRIKMYFPLIYLIFLPKVQDGVNFLKITLQQQTHIARVFLKIRIILFSDIEWSNTFIYLYKNAVQCDISRKYDPQKIWLQMHHDFCIERKIYSFNLDFNDYNEIFLGSCHI